MPGKYPSWQIKRYFTLALQTERRTIENKYGKFAQVRKRKLNSHIGLLLVSQ